MATASNVFFGMQIPLSSYLQVFFCAFNDLFMSIGLMLEAPESNLMQRKPRNAKKDRLTDWKFFLHIYLFNGLIMWITAMGMWFYYMNDTLGFGFYDLMFVYDRWKDGYKGYSIEVLTHAASVGNCC